MSPIELSQDACDFLDEQRVGHLATSTPDGEPHVVPLCYARLNQTLYFVCDEKPKRHGPRSLKRLSNLQKNGRAALVVDRYNEDWTKLAFLLLQLDAEVVVRDVEYEQALAALRSRYRQYENMSLTIDSNPMVRMTPSSAHFWKA